MKTRIICIILTTTLLLSIFVVPASAATTLKLNWKSITIGLEETYSLKATTNSIESITWSSSDKTIVSVNKNGKITGNKTGKAIITATANGNSVECKVAVKKAPDKISVTDITVPIGSTANIKATLPKGTASKSLSYESSNAKIANVNSNGIVTGVAEGSCTITVTTFNKKSVKIKVTVIKRNDYTVVQRDWIYSSKPDSFDGYVYRTSVDGTKRTKLTDILTSSFYVIDDWIYYSSVLGIYKVRTNGTNKITLTEGGNDIIIVDDWIYYEREGIYKIRTDGTMKTKLCNDTTVRRLFIADGWIYYSNWDDGHNLYKIKTDGTMRTKLNDDITSPIAIEGEWFYYLKVETYNKDGQPQREEDIFQLYKIRTNGTGRKKIFSKNNNNIMSIENGWIYYYDYNSSDESEYGYYKMRTDGTEKTKLLNLSETDLTIVVGDWIYFYTGVDFYKKRTDGTEKTKLCGDVHNVRHFEIVGDWIYYYEEQYNWSDYEWYRTYNKIRIDGTEHLKEW